MTSENDSSSNQYQYYPQPKEPTQEDSTLLYYVNIVRRRLWTVGAIFLVATTIGVINAYRSPRIYQASAKVMIERQVPKVVRFEGVTQDYGGWDPEFYSTQAELVRSRTVLEKVLEQKGMAGAFQPSTAAATGRSSLFDETRRTVVALLGAIPAPPPEPWELLRSQFGVTVMRDTHFLLIRSEGTDPRRASEVVNAVATAFEQYSLERKVESYGEAFLFLEREKKKQEELLSQAEKEFQEFRQAAKQVTLTGKEEDQPALKRLRELSEKLTQVQLDRIEYTAQMSVVRDVLGGENQGPKDMNERLLSLSAVRNDPSVTEVQRKLALAREDADRMGSIYGPEHPMLKDAQASVALQEKQFRDVLGQLLFSLEGRLKVLQNQEEELRKEEEVQKLNAVDLAKEVFTYTRLENTIASHRKLYDVLVERMHEVDVSSGFIKTNVQVIEKAGVPSVPIRPLRGRMIIMAMLIGLAMGVGIGFVFENLDDTIKTPEDLKQHIDIPLLGFVPRVKRKVSKDGEKDEMFRSTGLVSLKEPVSSVSEAYRNIRTSILFSIPAGEIKIIGVTSANPSEGKTTTACNLAVVTALSGKNVLLIDADIHRPMVGRVFGLEGGNGLTNILTGNIELSETIRHFTFKSPVAGKLDIITAGPESPNPAELIGSQKMKDILKEVKPRYDWVFLDIPPVLYISDAGILSALSEGIILIVRSGINNKSILMKTKERLDELKARVIGCVLNDVMVSRLGRYYSDYAYYGYSKYAAKYHKSYYSRDGEKDRQGKDPAKSDSA